MLTCPCESAHCDTAYVAILEGMRQGGGGAAVLDFSRSLDDGKRHPWIAVPQIPSDIPPFIGKLRTDLLAGIAIEGRNQ